MDSLSRFIAQKLKELNLSERELATRCGVSHSYINQLVKGVNPSTRKKINPTIKTLQKIAMGLETPVEVLEKIERGIPFNDALANKETESLLQKIEEKGSREGIPVGSNGDRVIPWELWDQIKEANRIFGTLGIDPSKLSGEAWSRLLEDINLVIKLHTEKR